MQTGRLSTCGRDVCRIMAALACLSLSIALIGCNSDSESLPTEGAVSAEMMAATPPPSVDELQDALDLRPEQVEPLRAALTRWQESMVACASPRERGGGRRGDGRGADRGRRGGERSDQCEPADRDAMIAPMVDFLAECNRILDAEQLAGLATLLRERRRAGRGEDHQTGRRGGCGRMLAPLPEELELTDEQRTEWRAACEAGCVAVRELRAAFAAGEVTDEELAAGLATIRAQRDEQLQEILTAEQYARLQELRCERQASMAMRMSEHLAAAHERQLEHLTRILDLTEEQEQQIVAIHAAALPGVEEILARVQDCTITMREAAPELQALRQETTAAIRAVLTPEQAVVFDAIRELMNGHRRRGHPLQDAG